MAVNNSCYKYKEIFCSLSYTRLIELVLYLGLKL